MIQGMITQLQRTEHDGRSGEGLAEVAPAGERTVKAMMNPGYVRIRRHELRDLETVGAYVQEANVLNLCLGRAMVIQQRLDTVMAALATAISNLAARPRGKRTDFASMAQLTHALAHLSAQLTDSQRLMLDADRASLPDRTGAPEPRNRSFAPGQKVVPSSSEPHVIVREVGSHS